MDILTEYLVKTKTRLTYEKLLSYVWHDKQVQDKIIELNTIGQLFNKGQRSDESFLDDYAISSVRDYGKPDGAIKLYDTGDFYRSFSVLVEGVNAEISADPIKITEQGQRIDLFKEYGEDIVGLTEISKQELREVIRIPIQRFNKRGLSVN